MPQKQTLLTFDIQYLNSTDIDYFYNTDESLYRKWRYCKMYVQTVSLFMFMLGIFTWKQWEWQ